jgi:hypothetical protein
MQIQRGGARTYTSAVGSNWRVKTGSGSLFGIHGYIPNGGSVKAENTLNLGTTPDLNAVTSNATLAYYGPVTAAGTFNVFFEPGVGFDDGLTVAATSNARFTVIYE